MTFPDPARIVAERDQRDRKRLRDQLASQAMQGMLASNDCNLTALRTHAPARESLAQLSYQIADAMLKERDK